MKSIKWIVYAITCLQPFVWWIVYTFFRPRAIAAGTGEFLLYACLSSAMVSTLFGVILSVNLSLPKNKDDKPQDADNNFSTNN